MKTQNETGHAKNVANFERLITFVTGYGAYYNPSQTSITLSQMQNLLDNAIDSMNEVHTAFGVYSVAADARETAFAPLSNYIRRVSNALKASGASENIIESARSIIRKILGIRANPKKTDEEKQALEAKGITVTENSSSQMSYDNRLDNFHKLFTLLSNVPEYAPNETELTVAAQMSFYTSLKEKNHAVIQAATPLSNARFLRDSVLYLPDTGMVDISVAVKSYVKSVFGASNFQYKQLSALKFRRIKSKIGIYIIPSIPLNS